MTRLFAFILAASFAFTPVTFSQAVAAEQAEAAAAAPEKSALTKEQRNEKLLKATKGKKGAQKGGKKGGKKAGKKGGKKAGKKAAKAAAQ